MANAFAIPETLLSIVLGIPPGGRPRQHHYTDEPDYISGLEVRFFSLVQMLPALLFAAIAFFPPPSAHSHVPEPLFKLKRDVLYATEVRSGARGAVYYVPAKFAEALRSDAVVRTRVEEFVERETLYGYETACAAEEVRRDRAVESAKRKPRGEERDTALDEALKAPMPQCARRDAFGRGGGAAAAAG